VCALFVDQVHRPGHRADLFNEFIIDVGEHIDDCVTDA
jgi:hypothetical protein